MKYKVILYALIAGAICLCEAGCGPVVPKPIDDDVRALCGRMCAAMEANSCPGWRGSPGLDEEYGTGDDLDCVDSCSWSMREDPTLGPSLKCSAAADSCEQIDGCMQD